jgi:DNA-binding NtrC family response regulator
MSRILLANHETSTTSILTSLLKTEGYKVIAADAPAAVSDILKEQEFALSVIGVAKDNNQDLQLLQVLRKDHPKVPVVVLTDAGGASAESLVALKPFACIEKPLKLDNLMSAVQQAVDFDASEDADINMNLQLETNSLLEGIVAESPTMKNVCAMASRVAATDVAVLITGEAGNGKSLMASSVHNLSNRSGAFIAVDCDDSRAESQLFGAPGSPGAIEKAANGTLLFRNVDGLDARVQQKLSHVLKERSFLKPGTNKETPLTARIMASTDKDLSGLVDKGEFSDTLHKQIKVIVIDIPPLRSRHMDIMPTVRMALRSAVGDNAALPSMDGELSAILEGYAWPGNSKQILTVMEDAVKKSKGSKITRAHLPAAILKG